MRKKYELTDEILEVGGHVLHRIKALRDLGDVRKGDIGGWIENEDNLSHDDDCWVYGEAEVYGEAKVYGNAEVYGVARVYGEAMVYGEAKVCGNAIVEKNPTISCSRIGGAVEDILLGHTRTICGLLGAFTVRVRNLSRRLMLTARRKVVSMRE